MRTILRFLSFLLGVESGSTVRLRCAVPAPGRYVARLFTNRERFWTSTSIAAIDVLAR